MAKTNSRNGLSLIAGRISALSSGVRMRLASPLGAASSRLLSGWAVKAPGVGPVEIAFDRDDGIATASLPSGMAVEPAGDVQRL